MSHNLFALTEAHKCVRNRWWAKHSCSTQKNYTHTHHILWSNAIPMDSRRVQFNSIFTLIYCVLCATRDDVVVLSSACTRYCSCENYTILVSLVAFSTSKFLSFFLARNNIYFFLYALGCIVWIHGACTPIYLVFAVPHISLIGGRATHNSAMGSNREPFQHNGIWKSYFTKLLYFHRATRLLSSGCFLSRSHCFYSWVNRTSTHTNRQQNTSL